MTYRKKRIFPSPNKNIAKVRRRESGENAGFTMGHLFPTVDQLSIQLEFLDAKGNSLDQRAYAVEGHEPITFQIDCLGPCGNGKIDLENKIQDMVRRKESASEGRAKCSQTLFPGSSDVCGYELRCKINVAYKPGTDSLP